MPILNDLWLYIHVNMIIASYALIGIAFVTAAIFVVRRLVIRPTVGLWYAMLIPAVFIPLPATIPDISLNAVLPAWTPFLIVIGFTLLAYGVRFISAVIPTGSPAVAGIVSESSGSLSAAGDVDSIGNGSRIESVLDGSTMLILELALVMLWTGIVMGAIWADHSWGRPWGWDPKEVFALNTWIIFLILVHLRYKVRDKAAWTAVMAVIGCAVMLFNWIVVNFFITGLHSYA
jgi:ABC-type transport system involved in cytochrome c biogenesis permease subunit